MTAPLLPSRPGLSRLGLIACLSLAAWAHTPYAFAAPYTPERDDEVLTTLPQRVGSSPAAERAARARLRAAPDNLPLALALARQALAQSHLSGDPRELGLAQAALAPWWALAEPPAAVRLLRASVQQEPAQLRRGTG